MKLSRQWLRAMKVYGQDGNCSMPVGRREGNKLLRKYKEEARRIKRITRDVLKRYGKTFEQLAASERGDVEREIINEFSKEGS